MRKVKACLCIVCVLAISMLAGADDLKRPTVSPDNKALERFSPEQREQLLKGEAIYKYVISDDPNNPLTGHAEAIVLIEKPAKECFELFGQYDKQYMWLPYMTKSEIIEKNEKGTVVYKELHVIAVDVAYHVIFTTDEKEMRHDFILDPSRPSDQTLSKGYFDFDVVDEDTALYTYALLEADIGIPVPQFVQDYLTSRDLPEVATNCKKWIESDGTWNKDSDKDN